MLAHAGRDPALGNTVGSSSVLRAEVVHAVRDEMALTLADVALRRTDLATGGHPGDAALDDCAALAAAELGWDDGRRAEERADLESVFPPWRRGPSPRVGEAGSPSIARATAR